MRFADLIIIVLMFTTGAGFAASPMVEAYKAYLAALERGDIISADREGNKAWKAAEEANNERYSAILAYNLAELRVRYLPDADASKPAKRAYNLTRTSSDAALALQNAQVLMALTSFMNKPQKNTRRTLNRALNAFELAGLEMNYPVFRSHFELMRDASNQKYWKLTRKEAKAANAAYQLLEMNEAPTLASIKLFNASAILIQSDFREIEEAKKELQTIIDLTEPAREGPLNPVVSYAIAWGMAAQSMQNSRGVSKKKLINIDTSILNSRPENCPNVKWISRKEPEYPKNLAKKGYNGAALIQFTLGEDGIPTDVKVAAEVPMPMFGKFAAQVVPSWRAEPLPGVPLKCRNFIHTPFLFQMAH